MYVIVIIILVLFTDCYRSSEHNRHECMLHNGQQNESADIFLLTIQNPIMYVGTYL